MNEKENHEKTINILETNIPETNGNIRNNRKSENKMGKSVSIYLGDNALTTLENIKTFFKNYGINPADSGIMAAALATYGWYLGAKNKPLPYCPNAACGEQLTGCEKECPACKQVIKWIAITP